jgi:hypothetical protein
LAWITVCLLILQGCKSSESSPEHDFSKLSVAEAKAIYDDWSAECQRRRELANAREGLRMISELEQAKQWCDENEPPNSATHVLADSSLQKLTGDEVSIQWPHGRAFHSPVLKSEGLTEYWYMWPIGRKFEGDAQPDYLMAAYVPNGFDPEADSQFSIRLAGGVSVLMAYYYSEMNITESVPFPERMLTDPVMVQGQQGHFVHVPGAESHPDDWQSVAWREMFPDGSVMTWMVDGGAEYYERDDLIGIANDLQLLE